MPIKAIKSEFIRYVGGGVSITVLNAGLYTFLLFVGVEYMVANLVALVVAKIYGYFVNKFFVYQSSGLGLRETVVEGIKYFISRFLTAVLDFVLLYVLVDCFAFPPLISKYGVVIVVIIVNYLLGKFFVFNGK